MTFLVGKENDITSNVAQRKAECLGSLLFFILQALHGKRDKDALKC